jgi:hypothetical protein
LSNDTPVRDDIPEFIEKASDAAALRFASATKIGRPFTRACLHANFANAVPTALGKKVFITSRKSEGKRRTGFPTKRPQLGYVE